MKKLNPTVILILAVVAVLICAGVVLSLLKPSPDRLCMELKDKAFIAMRQGDVKAGERFFIEAIAQAEHSKNALDLPNTLCDLADVYIKNNEDAKAQTCLSRAAKLFSTLASSSNSPDGETKSIILGKRINTEVELARIYTRQGLFDKAKAAYERALKMQKQDNSSLGPDSVAEEYADLLREMGATSQAAAVDSGVSINYGSTRDWSTFTSEANTKMMHGLPTEDFIGDFEVAASIARNHKSSSNLVRSLSDMAIARIADKKYDMADKLLKDALQVRIGAVDSQFKMREANALQLDSYCLNCLKRKKDSDEAFQKLVETAPEFAATPGQLTVLHYLISVRADKETAKQLGEWICEKHKALIGADDIAQEVLFDSLAVEKIWSLKAEEAEDYYRKLAKLKGKNNLDWLSVDQCIGLAQCFSQQNFDKAERYWRRCLALAKDDERKANIARALANFLCERGTRGRESEIESLIHQSWTFCEKTKVHPALNTDLIILLACRKSKGKEITRQALAREVFQQCMAGEWKNAGLLSGSALEAAMPFIGEEKYQEYIDLCRPAVTKLEQQEYTDYELRTLIGYLAFALAMTDKLDEAKRRSDGLIALKLETSGAIPWKAFALNTQGLIYDFQGKADAADKMYGRARTVLQDRRLQLAEFGLFNRALYGKHPERAKKLCLVEIEKAERLNDQSVDFGGVLTTMADYLNHENKKKEAAVYYEKAMAVYARNEGADARTQERNCLMHYKGAKAVEEFYAKR